MTLFAFPSAISFWIIRNKYIRRKKYSVCTCVEQSSRAADIVVNLRNSRRR